MYGEAIINDGVNDYSELDVIGKKLAPFLHQPVIAVSWPSPGHNESGIPGARR
jgi:hypothetical protein